MGCPWSGPPRAARSPSSTPLPDVRTVGSSIPSDEPALAAILIEVVNDAAERRARGEAAYEQIRDAYAWDTVATRVASLYESMLAAMGTSQAQT